MESFIDQAVEQYAHDHTKPESDLFHKLRDETYAEMSSPQMQVGRIEGRFLKMLVRLTGARRILEIGMFTGYSALMMAEGLPEDGQLITCDVNPKAEAIARRYFDESPNGHKIEIRMGPALETIKTLSGPLDMVFIDADKSNYSNYYEACFPLVKPGGLIVGDILVAVAGVPVLHHDELFTRLDGDVVGKSTLIDVLRGGQPQTVNVVVGER